MIEMATNIQAGFGIDISDEMINVAKERASSYLNLKFMVASAELIPHEIGDNGINKIYSNYALHHLPDKLKSESIKKLADILCQGGKMVLGDLMFSDSPKHYTEIFDYYGYGPDDDTPATVPNLKSMFINAGLKPEIRLLSPIAGVIIGSKI